MFGFKTFAEKQIERKGRAYDHIMRGYKEDMASIERLKSQLEIEVEKVAVENTRLRAALKRYLDGTRKPVT